ncbi:uncharacterized protein MONOS_18677 [Monocercomonoides exilis]|uniref:uncharacterized protein n=1 Tax=Monocercomonoides exilis TaxID=2049356 RepID=UPI00355A921B|nr:hypothetical protein MONOS_18677 [Monocercomonoides exilis]
MMFFFIFDNDVYLKFITRTFNSMKTACIWHVVFLSSPTFPMKLCNSTIRNNHRKELRYAKSVVKNFDLILV